LQRDPDEAGETGGAAVIRGTEDIVGIDASSGRGMSAPGDQPTTSIPVIPLGRTAILGFIGMLSVAIGAMLGGQSFETHLPGAWFFGMPGSHLGSLGSDASQPPADALLMVYGGLILLCRVWWQLLNKLRANKGFPVKKIVVVICIWAVPLLLAPPLFSRDAYSYAGQGEEVSHNIDPYKYGVVVLGSTSYSTLPDITNWGDSPSPYGPTFLSIDGALDAASHHTFLADLVLLRLLELAGLALAIAATPTIARSLKRDPAHAVLLGAGSPLILTTLIGGAHNEALMLGFLLAGLAAYKRWGPVPGIILCALAAGVKAPAGLGVVFIGWLWAGHGASIKRRIAHTALAGLIAAATLEVVTAISGVGWGWIGAALGGDKSFTGVTPVSAAARLVWGLGWVANLNISLMGAHTVFSILGLTIAGAIGWWLLLKSPTHGLVLCLGLTLLAGALLGPVVWAWYVTWGVLVLAPVASGWVRKLVMVMGVYWTFVGVTGVKNVAATLFHTNVLEDLIVLAGIGALLIYPLNLFEKRHRRSGRLSLSSRPNTPSSSGGLLPV
jgi:hypothetical protein